LEVAGVIYGANILLAAMANMFLHMYIEKSESIENGELSSRMRKQSVIRRAIIVVFFIFGILASLGGMYYFSIGLYLVPVVFNNIPGSLNFMEKIFGFELK
jgi:hypothetical protein